MQKLSNEELKREFQSPRNRARLAWMALIFLVACAGVFLMLLFDPFDWMSGPPPVHEAKKWLVFCVCFMWIPVLAGIWFMVVRPLQTGIVSGGSRYRAPYVVLRSEQPERFRALIQWNCLLLAGAMAIATYVLIGFVHDLRKAEAEQPSTTHTPTQER